MPDPLHLWQGACALVLITVWAYALTAEYRDHRTRKDHR